MQVASLPTQHCFYCSIWGNQLFDLTLFPFSGPPSVSYTGFVFEGWRRISGEVPTTENVLKARELELQPVLKEHGSEVRLPTGGAHYICMFTVIL